MSLRPLGPESALPPVRGVGDLGRDSQVLDNTEAESRAGVEDLLPDGAHESGGRTFRRQLAADLRRSGWLARRPEQDWTVADVASVFGCTRQTVHKWMDTGKLKFVLVGNDRRVTPEDLDTFRAARAAVRPPLTEDWFSTWHCAGLRLGRSGLCLGRSSPILVGGDSRWPPLLTRSKPAFAG